MTNKIIFLRIFHGLCTAYFLLCLVYFYYAAFTATYDLYLVIVVVSLGIEGMLVFGLNKGNCPLMYLQRKVNDQKPFFELFLPAPFAKRAIPLFALLTLVPIALILCAYIRVNTLLF